ncbi:MAG TPA: hypothetical protein VNF71_14490 [Acidimicrobiales bacterium]|nr:hypothetical protein [Acidimicrobiales bacterium]
MHLKTMLALGDGRGVEEGVGTLVGTADPVGVAGGSGVAHPAVRTESSAAANIFIGE